MVAGRMETMGSKPGLDLGRDVSTTRVDNGNVSGTEDVEHIGTKIDALKRLVARSGKEPHHVIQVSDEMGYTYDGLVFTTIRYPFGFAARFLAPKLGPVLAHLSHPKISVGASYVTFTEGPKTFKVLKAANPPIQSDREKPEDWVEISGAWMKRLVPLLPPSVTGLGGYPGVLACPQGYVGTDGAILGHIECSGPTEGIIIHRKLLECLPPEPIKIYTTEGTVWAETQDTTWVSPTLAGAYPAWEGAFIETTKEATVPRSELLEAFRTALVAGRYVQLTMTKEGGTVTSLSGDDIDATSSANCTFDVEEINESISIPIDIRKLLDAIDKTNGEFIKLSTDSHQDRLYVVPIGSTPPTRYMLAGIRGFGPLPDDDTGA